MLLSDVGLDTNFVEHDFVIFGKAVSFLGMYVRHTLTGDVQKDVRYRLVIGYNGKKEHPKNLREMLEAKENGLEAGRSHETRGFWRAEKKRWCPEGKGVSLPSAAFD